MLKNPISALKEKVTQYIHLRFELIRLEAIERLVNVMGYFAFIMIALFLSFAFGIFLFLGVAECMKILLRSAVYGYLSTAGILLLFCIIAALCSKQIIRFFAGKMAALLTNTKPKEEDAEEDDAE